MGLFDRFKPSPDINRRCDGDHSTYEVSRESTHLESNELDDGIEHVFVDMVLYECEDCMRSITLYERERSRKVTE